MKYADSTRGGGGAGLGRRLTEFGILGTLTVARESEPIDVRGPRQRALLALLLLHANQLVTADRIVDLLWQGDPPRTAANTLQTHIVRLRKALGARRAGDEHGPLRTIPVGYVLEVGTDTLDSERFERLLGEARRAVTLERHAVAREMLRNALALWRGPALVEFASEPFAQIDAIRLDELRIDAQQEFAAAALAGEFDETERLITEGMHVAPEVFGYAIQGFAGQLCTLRIEQGRAAEVLDAGRNFVAQYPQVPAWRAGLSVILAELGLDDEAGEQLAILTGGGLAGIRRDQEWLFLMGAVAETCSLIGARDVAAECYELLTPFSDRCIVLGDGYVLWCSVEKSLGILARTLRCAEVSCRQSRTGAVRAPQTGRAATRRATNLELARALNDAHADPKAVTHRLELARREATALGQYGLLRWIEMFGSTLGGKHRPAASGATMRSGISP